MISSVNLSAPCTGSNCKDDSWIANHVYSYYKCHLLLCTLVAPHLTFSALEGFVYFECSMPTCNILNCSFHTICHNFNSSTREMLLTTISCLSTHLNLLNFSIFHSPAKAFYIFPAFAVVFLKFPYLLVVYV